jgi:hypothetical protein
MNTLEHYILEIHSEKQDEKYPDMLEVDVTYNCYGSKQRTIHLTFKERWEIDKQRGYFMA